MALQKSELLSALGTAFQIFKAITDEVLNLGGNDEDVRKILKCEELRKKIGKLLTEVVRPVFKVVVDYSCSLAEMISAGHYNWTHNDITTEHFPVQGEGKQEIEITLFHFGKTTTSEEVLAEMEKQGYRPATIEELLALGASQPELQKQFPIVAFGSCWRSQGGRRRVPYLYWSCNERELNLGWFEDDWGGYCRFLAVRNAS